MPRPTTTSLGLALGTRPVGTPILPLLGGTPKIMAIGDSTTRGEGSADSGGYRTLLDARLESAGIARQWVGPNLDGGLNHFGVSGAKIADITSTLAARIATHAPNVCILILGVNNTANDTDTANAPADLATLLATAYTADPTIRWVVGHITPRNDAAVMARVLTVRAGQPAVWQASDQWADGLMVETAGFQDLAQYSPSHVPDNTHPSPIGYGLCADRMWPGLLNALGRNATW